MRTCMFSVVLCFLVLPAAAQVSPPPKAESVGSAESKVAPDTAKESKTPEAALLTRLLKSLDSVIDLGPSASELSLAASKAHPLPKAHPVFKFLAEQLGALPELEEKDKPSIEEIKKAFGAFDLQLSDVMEHGIAHELAVVDALLASEGLHQQFLETLKAHLVTPLDRLLDSYDRLIALAPFEAPSLSNFKGEHELRTVRRVLSWVSAEVSKVEEVEEGNPRDPDAKAKVLHNDMAPDKGAKPNPYHTASKQFSELLDDFMLLGESQRDDLARAIKKSKAPRLELLKTLDQHLSIPLNELLASLEAVLQFERHAYTATRQQRRKHPIVPARSNIRLVAKHLSKLNRPDPAPEKAVVAACVSSFTGLLGEIIKTGSARIKEVELAAGRASGFQQKFLKSLASRLAVHVAYEEIALYVDKGGQFEGMYPKTAALGRHGGLAMVDLFTDFDLDPKIRSLAGEGAAQLGSKADLEAVRVVYEDELEEDSLRAKTKIVLARLGDRSLVDVDFKAWAKLVEDNKTKYTESYKKYEALMPEFTKLTKLTKKTEEQTARLAELTKERTQVVSDINNSVSTLGQVHYQTGFRYLDIRDWKAAADSLERCINCYRQLASGGRPNQRLIDTVSGAYYNRACALARLGLKEKGLEAVEESFRWGYKNYSWALADRDLESLEGKDKALSKLVKEVQDGTAIKRWKKEAEEKRKAAAKKAQSGAGS